MKRATRYLSLLAMAAFLVITGTQIPSAGAAPAWQQDWNGGAAQRNLQEFDQFLNRHPWIAHKLWQKPSRANSKDFQGDNPELKFWLENHPWARSQFRADARGFMERERDFERSGARFSRYSNYQSYGPWNNEAARGQMAQFSQFLDDNPGLARQLAHNPGLVNNPGYLGHHKELRAFLNSHPQVRNRLDNDPGAFFAWYGSYDWYGAGGR
ncbi:MAG: hypothetical protein ACRD3T_06010 [Terriglobia bacterium]